MKKFSFWYQWLFVVGLLLVVFGIALAFFNQTQFFYFLFNERINPIFWKDGQVLPEMIRFQQWAYGVLGATIAGWGICVVFLAHYPFRNKERWAWNALTLGITVWFVIDTAFSLYFRVIFNAAFNTILLFVFCLPLAFTRRHFMFYQEGGST